MQATLNVLNDMVKNKVIANYAIGGAMALLFYVEPTTTYDLGVFVFMPETESSSLLVNLDSIYSYCKKHRYPAKQEHLIIEGIAVQFIPAYNNLVEEAVRTAKTKAYGQTRVRVLALC